MEDFNKKCIENMIAWLEQHGLQAEEPTQGEHKRPPIITVKEVKTERSEHDARRVRENQ